MAGIDWSLAQTDPIAQQARGFSYADKIAQSAATQQAGQKFATGDYKGAVSDLASSGNIPEAMQVQQVQQQQTDRGVKSAEGVRDYVSKALPIFQHIAEVHAGDPDGGSGAIGQAFDHIAPELSQLTGHDDQTVAQMRQQLVSDPKGTLDRLQAQIPATYEKVGNTIVRRQGDAVKPVYTGQAPAPTGYVRQPDNSLTFEKGGPADPSVVKKLATDRREVIINNPIPTPGTGPVNLGTPDPTAPNITGQTGLSMNGFNYLVGNMAAMGRDKETRNKAAAEAGAFAAKSGTDVATIKARYTALNNTLQNNLQRANQMEVLEQEVQGTVQNLAPVADKISPSNIKWTREGVQFVGGIQNDPNVQEYTTYLNQLRADLAGFNAVSGGKMTENGNARTDESDFAAAEKIIGNGLNSGGARGLAHAIQMTGQKNRAIVDTAVDNANKRVWDLFGVGKNYHATGKSADLKSKYGLE